MNTGCIVCKIAVNKCNCGSEACKKKLLELGQDYHRGHDIMGPQTFLFAFLFAKCEKCMTKIVST